MVASSEAAADLHAAAPPGRAIVPLLDLAAIIYPDVPATDLSVLAEALGLELDEDGPAGEAGSLARTAARVIADACQVDSITLQHVVHLSAAVREWPTRRVFASLAEQRARDQMESGTLEEASVAAWLAPTRKTSPGRRRSRAEAAPSPLNPAEMRGLFAEDGPLAAALPSFEPREEQLSMLDAVTEVISEGGQLLVEAGTGTGKSLAYLVPSMVHAVRNHCRVVVSTATTNLQDQLLRHDVPLAAAALGPRTSLRASVLKGRGNYLCLTRLHLLLQSPDLSEVERVFLVKLLFWVPRTQTGDRAELRLSPREEQAWRRVCAEADWCTPTRCTYHRAGTCYLARARQTADESDVVIANHALLLSDVVNRSRVLPDYDVLVLDEAHHLEDEATAHFGWCVSARELTSRLDEVWSVATGTPPGVLSESLAILHARGSAQTGLGDQTSSDALVASIRRGILDTFERFTELVPGRGSDGAACRLTAGLRGSSVWQDVETVWDGTARLIVRLLEQLLLAESSMSQLGSLSEAEAGLIQALGRAAESWGDWLDRLNPAIHQPDPDKVYWVSRGSLGGVWLNAAPIRVADQLREDLFVRPRAIAAVSATLSVAGSFAYVKSGLGLEEANDLQLGSPFDYRRSALVYVPDDLPDPTQPGYQEILERVLVDTACRLRGRLLVLFTSRVHLELTAGHLRRALTQSGIAVLAQGLDDGSRTHLLESFRAARGAVLLGTSSFWEGIDVVGDALSCVAIVRLPFAVPTDPIYQARAEQFDDPFSQYAVPQAVLRFKQGFGRLIRSQRDRGAVLVLDRRLVTRRYGAVFLRSLPDCGVEQGPAARAGTVVQTWLTKARGAT